MIEEEDEERISIRKELSDMSFEKIQTLKEKLGTKKYDETVLGVKTKERTTKFKRENKNRPREVSSKIRVKNPHEIVQVKKKFARDPRFDNLCGTFSDKKFRSAYRFIDEIKEQEKQQLKNDLKNETDEKLQKKMRYLIKRMENKEREARKRKMIEGRKRSEYNAKVECLSQGKKPVFRKKSEIRTMDLVEQYEALKKTGKLQKYIEKQRRKNKCRDQKKLNFISDAKSITGGSNWELV